MTQRRHVIKGYHEIIDEGNMYDDLDIKAQKIFDLVSPYMTILSRNRWKKKLEHILKFDRNYGDHEVKYFDDKFVTMMYDLCDFEKIWVE